MTKPLTKNSKIKSTITIVILGLIMGMALLIEIYFGRWTNRFQFFIHPQKTTITYYNLKVLNSALNTYRKDCRKFPESLDLLTKTYEGCKDRGERAWGEKTYMELIPTDAWGDAYIYINDNGYYMLKSKNIDQTFENNSLSKIIYFDSPPIFENPL